MRLPVLLALGAVCLAAGEPSNPDEFFEMRVRPVLVKNCFACHTSARMGGLQLDSREHLLAGGKDGAVVVPGHADQSVLYQAVSQTHPRIKMPPGGKLADPDIAALKAWIDAGAAWPKGAAVLKPGYTITREQRAFWAFRPVSDPAVPAVRDRAWARNDIDRFILAKLEAKGVAPVRAADRRTLLRRATYDLIGLPPTPEEVDAFLSDRSSDAFAKVVDRLLASPRYGERWGRYWLDVARYSDDRLNSTQDDPYPNSFRYRDWVIRAFNQDMPYNRFVEAQIAGDLMPSRDPLEYRPGLGFYALSPEFQDDRVDATTRGFLGLTVACAQCHDHKYDPIPSQDYYSLLGVFNNTRLGEYPLAPAATVEAWRKQKEKLDHEQQALHKFVEEQSMGLAEILASQTEGFLLASAGAVESQGLDAPTLERWKKYLAKTSREHPYLKRWDELAARHAGAEELRAAAREFQQTVLAVNEEKKLVDEKNRITLGLNPSRNDLSRASLVSLDRDKYMLWRDLFGDKGVLRYQDKELPGYLSGQWKQHLERLTAEAAERKKALPPQYPFLQVVEDVSELKQQHVYIRGDRSNQGEEAPPRFLAILSPPDRKPFTHGSGRLDLAQAIIDPGNPLTARVMVNRIWQHHFGEGLVRTPSNFGKLGDRPSNPELLDYLARWFVRHGWSVKAMHREIMLSAVYQLSSEYSARDYEADPDNRLVWRFNRRRLDAEALRDSLLFVAGDLDLTAGGPAVPMKDDDRRRAVYGFVSRRKPDTYLALFDFPNPNATSDRRLITNVPLQRLFFMNSDFVIEEARHLATRMEAAPSARERIRRAYRLLFDREPTAAEVKLGLDFLERASVPQYAQVLLSSNEFSFVN